LQFRSENKKTFVQGREPQRAGNIPGSKSPGNKPLGRAIRYLARYRGLAVIPYLFLLIATLAQLMVPRVIGNIIDAITRGYLAGLITDRISQLPPDIVTAALERMGQSLEQIKIDQANAERTLIFAGFSILGLAIIRGIFAFFQTFLAERNSQEVAFDLRNDLFEKIQRLSFSYHDRNQTGQLMIRATDDVEKVRIFIGQGLLQAVGALVLLAGSLIILFATNARLTLVLLPILPLVLVLFMIFGKVSQPLFTKVQMFLSNLNTLLQENLAGIRVVKAFTQEKSEEQKFEKAADILKDQQIQVAKIFSLLFPFTFLIASLGQAAITYFGGRQIIFNTLTIGEWQQFSLYLVYLFLPMAQIGFIITQMSQASASADRVFEILDTQSDVNDKPNAQEMPPVTGRVQFENVSFRYFSGGEAVLSEINFTAEPGQSIALLGATGSGKTTIINLLPRFYDPTEGHITIDGYDLRDITLESLRSQIGIVLQDTTLFTGTIRDNIAFGRPDASDEEIQSAAKAASAHEFIMDFQQGYETPVGERGATLSGGQKQRIAIARALLLNPRILILDDSTSSVDLATEYQIQKSLDELMVGRTSFVIAQRISTVINADLILVLENGTIVARGTHDELLETSEVYAEIYNSQLIGDAVEQQVHSLDEVHS
jgi:ATP-binding cassette, subfamily B, multidrug efflux pump